MEERERVISIARQWQGTPFHHAAKVKGAGVDCLHFISETYREAGIVDVDDIPKYPWQWNLNKCEETYIQGLLRYAHEVDTPLPADIAIWKIGRTFSHAAIVIDWPLIIHSVTKIGVIEDNVVHAVWLMKKGAANRPLKFFSYW